MVCPRRALCVFYNSVMRPGLPGLYNWNQVTPNSRPVQGAGKATRAVSSERQKSKQLLHVAWLLIAAVQHKPRCAQESAEFQQRLTDRWPFCPCLGSDECYAKSDRIAVSLRAMLLSHGLGIGPSSEVMPKPLATSY